MLTRDELLDLGFAHLGDDVRVSDRASFHNCAQISLGSHVRIDDFAVLSAGAGGIVIRDYVHIAVGVSLIGAGRITLSDFAGLSSRVAVYSSNDDYSGKFLTGPTVPNQYRNTRHADVHVGKHVIVGSGAVILPGVTIHDGAAIGALSLVNADCEEFAIYVGAPARRIRDRSRQLLALEADLRRVSSR